MDEDMDGRLLVIGAINFCREDVGTFSDFVTSVSCFPDA